MISKEQIADLPLPIKKFLHEHSEPQRYAGKSVLFHLRCLARRHKFFNPMVGSIYVCEKCGNAIGFSPYAD